MTNHLLLLLLLLLLQLQLLLRLLLRMVVVVIVSLPLPCLCRGTSSARSVLALLGSLLAREEDPVGKQELPQRQRGARREDPLGDRG